MQNQKEMHQKIQRPEVPSDPRASYPFPHAFVTLTATSFLPSSLLTYLLIYLPTDPSSLSGLFMPVDFMSLLTSLSQGSSTHLSVVFLARSDK